jgi:hypothetical protein
MRFLWLSRFSRLGGANIDKIWIGQGDERKKLKFFEKYCVHNQKTIISTHNFCNEEALEILEVGFFG